MGMGVNLGDSSGGDDNDIPETVVAEINITPLTDVFLVLLIIFMVTANALAEAETQARAGVRVTLPKSSAAAPLTKKRTDPIVTVTKDNKILLFNRQIDPNNLEAEIKKALEDVGSETLILKTDTSTVMGAAVNVMSAGRKAGAKNIGILTDQAAGGK